MAEVRSPPQGRKAACPSDPALFGRNMKVQHFSITITIKRPFSTANVNGWRLTLPHQRLKFRRAIRTATLAKTLGYGLLALLVLPFAYYAVNFGEAGLRQALPEPHYLFSENTAANMAIFAHMVMGGVITFLVPFQLMTALRRRYPALHRWSGRIIATAAIVTAMGGLVYIALRGTIGGLPMDAGFALYGALTLFAGARTWQLARQRDFRHHAAWALRFFWLAIASWLYRVQYGLWYLATDGLWSTPAFSGGFDLMMNVGFYLPHLIGVEIYLRTSHNKAARQSPA